MSSSLAQLAKAGRSPALPLTLDLADAAGSAVLNIERWLRVLPGQRYVAQATWRGRPVLAKLLVGSRAARQFERELSGARLLAEQGLPTPLLLADGLREGEGGWLLFDYLSDAQSLWDAWTAVASQELLSDGQQRVLGEALNAIAQMHSKGLWQADLHLDNLLRQGEQLFIIDGGGVQAQEPGKPLSRDLVLANLGVFFAQLPVEITPYIEELLVHYLLANGEHALPLEALLKQVAKVRKWRLRDYLRKIGRDCSLFAAKSGAFALQVVRRDEQAALAPLLADPDQTINGAQLYKTGGTATVAGVEVQGRRVVLKRYNIKGFKHWLTRFWRPSRAWHSWREGHRLQMLGIATPKPLAVLERRCLWLRGRAYLITEHLSGPDIIERFAPYVLSGDAPEAELQALDDLFAQLLRERISHGDFKGHNLFWDAGRWVLIDLDSMTQHASLSGFAQAFAKDRARFMRNWPQSSELYKVLDQRLPKQADTSA
ncbi:lipopolysaccharide kinase InaA family protein [Pseudomonas sp. 5P_3.1_Bac2]|uniref:lipopolysaccharide kinase InaA family protein n=1 Tax=Pseudomonas sp. 5P_3.1_Bac2 TaxID=2971617 RepID=UPI0021CA486B|nr:lipopolysaccharide kinase InaA family protein [Pseudomonas sp. 5P_3.1_Bac2]MCU1718342.1 phosphotransferase [Pseudomonas sp. 5P_3.1_Bac2]